MTTLFEFLNGEARNRWIDYEAFEIYVRKGPRIIENKRYECFDIANINSNSPGSGRLGFFFSDLNKMLKSTEYEVIFIENVLNYRLALSLVEKHYFKEIETFTDLTGPPCFYKRVK